MTEFTTGPRYFEGLENPARMENFVRDQIYFIIIANDKNEEKERINKIREENIKSNLHLLTFQTPILTT